MLCHSLCLTTLWLEIETLDVQRPDIFFLVYLPQRPDIFLVYLLDVRMLDNTAKLKNNSLRLNILCDLLLHESALQILNKYQRHRLRVNSSVT